MKEGIRVWKLSDFSVKLRVRAADLIWQCDLIFLRFNLLGSRASTDPGVSFKQKKR